MARIRGLREGNFLFGYGTFAREVGFGFRRIRGGMLLLVWWRMVRGEWRLKESVFPHSGVDRSGQGSRLSEYVSRES